MIYYAQRLHNEIESHEDMGVYNYNGNPYLIIVNGNCFKLLIDCDAANSYYLDNLSELGATAADCVYDHVTAACENLGLELNGFNGQTFNTKAISGDHEDRETAVEFLKYELYQAAGILMMGV